jgi:hypothetical protein
VIDTKQIDILHLHGYGATTFGRLAGAVRGTPTIVHEHANLTDTPWFQKIADRMLEPWTDIALAVSQSTADFVIRARQIPASKVKVVYIWVRRWRNSAGPAPPRKSTAPGGNWESEPATSRSVLSPASTNPREIRNLIDAAAAVVRDRSAARFFLVGEGPLLADTAGASGRARSGLALRLLGLQARRSPAPCRRSTSWYFRPCGKARR